MTGTELHLRSSRQTSIPVPSGSTRSTIAAAGGSYAAVEQGLASTYGGAANAAMEQAMTNLRNGTSGAVPPMTSTVDVQSRIEKLDQLKTSGLIDETQYAAKKQKLLDEL